jgi:parallel beta-helix repeat protein
MGKKTAGIVLFLWTGLAAMLATICFSARPVASAREIASFLYVAPGADCGDIVFSPCFDNVQGALDEAAEDDEIRVAEGTYADVTAREGVTQVVYISKTVTLRGGYATNDWSTSNPVRHPTILDGVGRGRVLHITGDANTNPVVEGFRITRGFADSDGGGIYVSGATATISNNLVLSNSAKYNGGGVYLDSSKARIISNTIEGNSSDLGGGLHLEASNARMDRNTVSGNVGKSVGGGVYLSDSSGASLTANKITGNIADDYGGGLRLLRSDATLDGNIITFNAAEEGAGLHLRESDAQISNSLIADNRTVTSGSGLYVESSSPRLNHVTLARNSGGDGTGIYITNLWPPFSTAVLTNTILVSHSVGIRVTRDNAVKITGMLWHSTSITISHSAQASVSVKKQYKGDPGFAPDGYHLTGGSEAIDKGAYSGVVTDIDGETRPDGCYPDLGADEFDAGAACYLAFMPVVLRRIP